LQLAFDLERPTKRGRGRPPGLTGGPHAALARRLIEAGLPAEAAVRIVIVWDDMAREDPLTDAARAA
jgi:hypothetical protein